MVIGSPCDCKFCSALKNGNCYICGFPLSKPFPEDFPDEWKFCCHCLWMAKVMIENPYFGFMLPNKAERIREKISLVG